MTELDSEVLLVLREFAGKLQPFFVSFSLMDAARETLQQQSTDSTHVVTPDAAIIGTMAAVDQIASLHLRIMELQEELLSKEINLGKMQAVYDNLYSMAGVAGRLPPDRQIAMLGKLVEMPLHEVPCLHRVQNPVSVRRVQ